MPTRLTDLVIDCPDPVSLAAWWSEALEWRVTNSSDYEANVEPLEGEPGIELTFVPVTDSKTGWNRVHLDLASRDAAHQAQIVARLESLGATRLDVADERPWVVLADPAGNEFCVLEHRDEYDGRGPVAAIVMKVPDVKVAGAFWQAAAAGELEITDDVVASLELTTPGPVLEFIRENEPKVVKNRIHLDLRPYAPDDQSAEVGRLIDLGARRVDVGQSADVTWTVLTGPDGNEFCVLSPRD
ncbi:VOC family protein [Kineosporia sp. NBRC 101731]|uniref:VOC family protein n=1 Tax=Kineosporia sp. NBRC 101731 TaxID=3032199 RepID=UPI0024A4504F|nr:VOC family protein [Kineosporia sp. NBRC 101731]GLY28722.1 hypothetical protein Kisp02_20870 [Kineosporia sp. NBRC 101731]